MRKQALIGVLAFCTFYGLQIVLQQKFVRTTLDPVQLTFFSYLYASLFLAAVGTAATRGRLLRNIPHKGVQFAFLVAVAGTLVADTLSVFAMRFSSSTNWAMLSRLQIVVTYFLAILFLGDKPTKYKTIAAVLGVMGSVLVVWKPGAVLVFNRGDLLFIVAMISMSVANIFSQKASKYISPIQLTLLRCVFGTVLIGILLAVIGFPSHVLIEPFVFYNAASFLIGISLVNFVIKKAGAAFFSVGAAMLPLFVATFSFLLFGTVPTLFQAVGGVCIIGAVVLFQKK